MTKLLLTSAGFLNEKITKVFLSELGKPANKAKVLMVTSARTDEEQFYIDASKKELEDLGVKDIITYRIDRQIQKEEMDTFDAVYVCGGNTYLIFDEMKKNHFDKMLINFVNKGGLYVGVSAGSIIPGPDIEIAGYGTGGDANDVNMEDTSGLNLISTAINPHFNQESIDEIEKFSKSVSYQVVSLTDQQAIFVEDGAVTLIK